MRLNSSGVEEKAVRFTKADFESRISTVFEVLLPSTGSVQIELIEVRDNSSASLDAFSLTFKGDTEQVFRHDTYLVRHADIGEFALFVGPVHTGKADVVHYEAIFSAPRRA